MADSLKKSVFFLHAGDGTMLVQNLIERNNVVGEEIISMPIGEGAKRIEGLLSEDPSAWPDLIILDVPQLDESTLGLICRIRCQGNFNPVPMVVLTEEANAASLNMGRGAGATSVIVKPKDVSELDEAVLHTMMYWLLLNQAAYKQVGLCSA